MFKKVVLIILSLMFMNPLFAEAKSGYLYDVLKNEAESNGLAREYTGSHHDSFTEEPSKKIYHWYAENDTDGTAILDKNNVIFAEHCWQMIRTTDTGGVKMIYNGEAENNQCLNNRGGKHIGYSSFASQNLASNYWYGTDYTYDSSTKRFKVSGTTQQEIWNENTGLGLIGKYTCKSTSVDDSCSTLYLVESYYNTSSAYVIALYPIPNYSQFGILKFNSNYSSLADVGYMYNTRHTYNSKTMTSSEAMLSSSSLGTNYWYADDIAWGNPVANRYNLINPYKSSTTDYPNLAGKYTFRNTTKTYTDTSVRYIVGVKGSIMYYISLDNSGNHTLADFNYTYTYGDSYTDNGNGTYTINNPTTISRSDWYTSYSNIGAYKYVCKNSTNNTCSDLWYITETSITSMTYIKVANNYKYAKGFTWDGNKYVLDNDASTSFWNIKDSNNQTSLNNAHYTCWNETGTCASISYIYYLSAGKIYYINLENGKSIEDAKNEMLYNNDVNQINSTIKSGVDAWYKHYMLNYDNYIEDTIFCNNRSQQNADTNGWNQNGGSIYTDIKFKEYIVTNNLDCTNATDRFSISNPNATLTYKVGLISSSEMNILNNAIIRKTDYSYWLGSPSYFDSYNNVTYGLIEGVYGNVYSSTVDGYYGVRPAVSLKTKTIYKSGNGSMENPYIIGDASKNNIIMNNDNTKGTISNLDETTDVYELSDVTFTITSKKGYYVERIDIENSNHEKINYEVNDNDYTFQMPDSDVTIIPIYEKIKSSINIQVVDETEDLNIEINDLTKVEYEEEVKFKVTPIKGYKITNIKIIDGENHEINYSKTSNKNEYKFIMPDSDVTIIPSYEKVKNSIVADKDTQSKEIIIKVEDATAVVYEDRVKFTVIAEEGYEVENILITDKKGNKIEYKKTDKEYEYEFIMPDSDVIIQPLFKKITDPHYIINPKTGRNYLLIIFIIIIIFTIKNTKRKRLILFK